MANYFLSVQLPKKELANIPLKTKKLQEIDALTMNFQSEEELKQFLLEKGLITLEQFNNKLAISYHYKGVKTIPVVYSGCMPYLSLEELNYILISKINNLDFLTKLCNRYYTTIPSELERHVYERKAKINRESEYPIMQEVLTDFLVCKQYDGNYKRLRDLGMFIYHYEKKQREKLQSQEEMKINNDKPKVLVKRKEETKRIENNQPSLFPEYD